MVPIKSDPNRDQNDLEAEHAGALSNVDENAAESRTRVETLVSYKAGAILSDEGTTTSDASRKKSFLRFALVVVTLLVLMGGSFYFFKDADKTEQAFKDGTSEESKILNLKVVNSYSSPVGFLPIFQDREVTSGSFELDVPFIDNGVKIEDKFYINDEGEVALRIIGNMKKVNGLLEYLYTKNSQNESTERPSDVDIRASEYGTLNFSTLLGLDSFVDTNNLFGGFFVYTQNALDGKKDNFSELSTRSESCKSSFEAVKIAFSVKSLNTVSLRPTYEKEGSMYVVKLDNKPIISAKDKAITYLEDCFDFSKPSPVEFNDYFEKFKEAELEFPKITIYEKDGVWTMLLGESENDAIKITITDVSSDSSSSINVSDSSSVLSMNNLFGIAYDSCRVPPVKLSDFSELTYEFIAESTNYSPPSNFDSGYACTVSKAEGYSSSTLGTIIKYPQGTITVRNDNLKEFQVVHEMRYLAEKYYLENGTYPPFVYLVSTLNQVSDLEEVVTALLETAQIKYNLLPEGCDQSCNDYKLTRIILDEQTNSTIELDAYSYEH